MCRTSKSSRADDPIGIWTKDLRQHHTREMHENIRLLTAGEATAAHHHLPYQRKAAGNLRRDSDPRRMGSLAAPLLDRFLGDMDLHVHTKSYLGVRMYSLSPHAMPVWSQNTPTVPISPARESECPHSPTVPICST